MITIKGLFKTFYTYSVWKTLYFNIKCLPMPMALKFPIYIARNVILRRLDGKVFVVANSIRRGTIRIGARDMGIQDERRYRSIIDLRENGVLSIGESTFLGGGTRLYIKGNLSIGKNAYFSLDTTIIAHEKVQIGDDVTIGWNTLIMDTDFHQIISIENSDLSFSITKPIKIGNHCWVCNGCKVMKGTELPDDTIVACNSLVNKRMNIPSHCLIAGMPVQIKKRNVTHIR